MREFVPILNRCEDASLKGLILHPRKNVAFLGSGSSTADVSEVLLPCEILWCSTVLEQQRLLMLKGSCCQNFSGHSCNISNHYYFDMVLAKDL